MDYLEHCNRVIQRRLPQLLHPPPAPKPLAPGAPQVKSWTNLCFLRESFAPGTFNDPERVYTAFAVATDDNYIFFGHAPFKLSEITFAQITASLEPVPDDHLFPLVSLGEQRGFTIAPGPEDLPRGAVHVKRNLGRYEDYRNRGVLGELPSCLLEEARVLEVIWRDPIIGHPNIIEYLGLRINRSRITGLVLRKYQYNLYQYLHLRHGSGIGSMPFTTENKEKFMQTLEDVVLRYLHLELGVAHNDINPFNVMVDVREGRPVPVLGGFGTARRIGERIGGRKGMPTGWTCWGARMRGGSMRLRR